MVSVEDIVTAPAFSVIVTFDPAVNASVSPSAKVLPPAVTDRTVSVSVTVVDIALFPSIDIPVPAVYSVFVSVEDITPFEISILVPAVNAACAFASVYWVMVEDIALFPSIDIPVPAVYSVFVSVEDITPFVRS